MSKPKYYISTAIAYTSSRPHIGNTYEIVLADSIARYKRMEGYDVYFQTGTDEHGQKIEEKANAAGITPKEYVDNVAKIVKANWDVMNTSYDKFIRTTDDYHEKQVQKIFKKLYEQGDIYKGHYEGMYCTPCESFFTESQLVDGKCPDCGGEVKPAKEEAYFFKMSKYADRLIDHINKHPEFIQPPQRKTEMMNNFLLPGLQDLCVSRTSFKWGIPVDFDDKHVVYVWLDALTNYITGIGYDCDGNSTEQFKRCQHIERVCNKARLGFKFERQLVFVKVVFVPHYNGIFAYCFQRYHSVLYARHTVKRISESFSWMICDCKCGKITVNKVENIIVGIDCFSVLYFAAIA